jgi:hypothetical protein
MYQVTVPDAIGAITSSGWVTVKNQAYLTEMIQEFQAQWHSYLYFCRSYYD